MQALKSGTQLRRCALGARTQCKPALPCLARRPARQSTVAVNARAASGGFRSSSPNVVDRVLAALPYILPYFDAVMYGRYLFYMYPWVKTAVTPLLPAMSLYHSLPMGSFLVFFGLYLGVVNNQSLSRFVRFNAVQAILLDILLVLPRLVETVFTPPTSGWGAQVYIQSQSFIWVFIAATVLYGIVCSFLGQYARLPFISDAADAQVR
ncbi:hypothetical protein HYH03_005722 [Edaphochlamys debaryana]|uniref:Protein TIC 20 n=1 Tax=Edaphochlamys debaryana TaxID=47281 RepID=A0A836C222_9CHLO|nr:hypothetical protein HYH03_005722 [Edaphochlamys debaryana]|eukprot:KAG2496119.1 hypothetical protein HYH03_005722 [Edaphochlamys debaryana]